MGRRDPRLRWAIAAYAALVAGVLLFPFEFTRNGVHHREGRGIYFDGRGIAWTERPLETEGRALSVEIWIREPDDLRWTTGTLLSLYNGTGRHPLVVGVRGSKPFLFDPSAPWDDYWFRQLQAPQRLVRGEDHMVAVTMSAQEKVIYVDGEEVARDERTAGSSGALDGTLVLGSLPENYDPWRGAMRGLALYGRLLQPSEVARHARHAADSGVEGLAAEPGLLALFAFDAASGGGMRNLVAGGPALAVPRLSRGLAGTVLDWPAPYRTKPRITVINGLTNVALFAPLGWLLGVAAVGMGRTRAGRALGAAGIVGACALLSLSLEAVQLFLPSRLPGLNDVLANATGAGLGTAVVLALRRPGSCRGAAVSSLFRTACR